MITGSDHLVRSCICRRQNRRRYQQRWMHKVTFWLVGSVAMIGVLCQPLWHRQMKQTGADTKPR